MVGLASEPKLKTIIEESIRRHGEEKTKEAFEVMKSRSENKDPFSDYYLDVDHVIFDMCLSLSKKGLHYMKHNRK